MGSATALAWGLEGKECVFEYATEIVYHAATRQQGNQRVAAIF